MRKGVFFNRKNFLIKEACWMPVCESVQRGLIGIFLK